jgi:hypothetical protein
VGHHFTSVGVEGLVEGPADMLLHLVVLLVEQQVL